MTIKQIYPLNKPPEISIRRWLQMVWNDVEWPIVLTIGILALILGTTGFREYYQKAGQTYPWIDCIYQALQLFSLNTGVIDPSISIPFSLQVGRFIAPAIAGYTLLQALMVVFKEQMLLIRLGFIRNHFIVCGLGSKGIRLVQELRYQNHPVVVVEQEGNNIQLETVRELGGLAIIGDALDSLVLRRAGVSRARHVILVTGSDSTNVEVAEQARRLTRIVRKSELVCTVHVADTYLWTLLRQLEFSDDEEDFFRLEFFNIYDSGARLLLRETFHTGYLNEKNPHFLVVGIGDLAEKLILHAAQTWYLSGFYERKGPLPVSILDPDAKIKSDALGWRYPLIKDVCRLMPHLFQANLPEPQIETLIKSIPENNPVTHAYVCLEDHSLGLRNGFALLDVLRKQKVQIMVRMTEDTGLVKDLHEIRTSQHDFANLRAFGLLDRTCKLELLDDGTHEILARVIHQVYVEERLQEGETPGSNTSLVSWDELSEELRQSNRNQAAHIGYKLNAIGCGLTPWRECGAEVFPFSEKEIEIMSILEHERWCREKTRYGWRYGPQRDNLARIHPDLLPWEDPRLTETTREKDRQFVTFIPSLLARVGYQVYRVK